jgi:hypothetical protein
VEGFRKDKGWGLTVGVWYSCILIVTQIVFVIGSSAASLNRDEQAARDFLNQYPVLRVAIKSAEGNGHQAAGTSLIKRLRQLEYAGHIELYFAPVVRKKLEYLLPPFRADGPDHQILRDLDVETFLLSSTPETRLPLGLMGADMNAGLNLTPEELNVESLLIVQPSRWGDCPYLFQTEGVEHCMFFVADHWPTRVPYSSPNSVGDYMTTQMSHSRVLTQKLAGLKTLVEGVRAGRWDLLSAYGLGIDGTQKLVTMLRVMEKLKRRATNVRLRPIVIGLLSNLNVGEWMDVYQKLAAIPELHRRVKWIDASKESASERLSELNSDDIAVFKIGNVPQDVWNFLMDESTLPPLAAGANGTNFLYEIGKPFVITAPGPSLDLTASSALSYGAQGLTSAMRAATESLVFDDAEGLTKFYLQALNSNSELNTQFRLHAQALKKLPDRTCSALLNAQKILGKPKAMQRRSSRPPTWPSLLRWILRRAG